MLTETGQRFRHQATDLASWRCTCWPGESWDKTCFDRSWSSFEWWWAKYFADEALRKSIGGFWEGSHGRHVRWLLPNINWDGLYPSARGTLRHSYNMYSGSSPEEMLFFRMFFTDLTPALARPLDFGLYGAKSSCRIPCVTQKDLKLPWNCGPPWLRIEEGQASKLNQEERQQMTLSEVVEHSKWYIG